MQVAPVALLGGTFDPVHYGHLALRATTCGDALGLADVRLVPAGDPPHRGAPVASAAHRAGDAAARGRESPGLVVDAREIARGGKSYTVLTLEELRARRAARPLAAAPRRRRVSRACRRGIAGARSSTLAHVVVVARPGVALDDACRRSSRPMDAPPASTSRRSCFATPAGVHLSCRRSRRSRSRRPRSARSSRAAPTASRRSRGLLPAAVLAYIDQHRPLLDHPPDAT